MTTTSNEQLAKTLETSDWSGTSIGNKAIIQAAIQALRDQEAACELLGHWLHTSNVCDDAQSDLCVETSVFLAKVGNAPQNVSEAIKEPQ